METKHTIKKPLKLSGVMGELVSKDIATELLEALEYAKNRILFLEQYTEGKCDKSKLDLINNAIKKATE